MYGSQTMNKWVMNTNGIIPKLRLFCLPYAGGGASIYREWQNFFSNEIQICPIQLPGRENRSFELPFKDINSLTRELADVLHPLLDIPFAVFGHSMGALIGYELTKMIQSTTGKSPLHMFVSGRSAPQFPNRSKCLHQLPDPDFIENLRDLNGTDETILQNKELMQILLPRLRADFEVCETYTYVNSSPLTCPISVYGGQDDEIEYSLLEAWSEHTTNQFEVKMFSGDHFFIHSSQNEVIKSVFSKIEHLLINQMHSEYVNIG